ncbi:putative CXXCH cytochrome family protein [Rhizobium leguminosarum]|uniref:CXXCH cytochrome family protein n=1 Tax=Rhizobium leguminosarum TaxID=384 RepID=A0AAE2MJU5_RHILE|nr:MULTISPECIES: HEAT repeat domain-containing protein [Rhizobium]MBB4290746.1 putative CXXCH cytochrome family protein [Rhizobium leguminosarum]MBB4297449.1 putative CXXCH cytochrome family protein [Rhizobium leguminosarum]MBB4307351.1 putative CXXCH cytochrome family protein [Rhizobium leguminosarum]MBB4415124.1 putative CXXCH cytochrome family protein [Rhizobium leguminosarum]MBB4431909.1 putative CXXCH cytochrome family protein [Rhizobium esperanzae]
MAATVRSTGVLLFLLLGFAGRSLAADSFSTPVPDSRISSHQGFADEETCASCHGDQATAFAKSHHANAMAIADEKTVRANFNTRFEHDGVATTFSRRDGRFFVRAEGPDGKETEFEVKYTFAYEPLQQYLVDMGGGRLQALDVAWDTAKHRWFWLGNGAAAKAGSTYHWTGPFYRWNRTCIDCHSTDPQANFQPATNEYNSTYVATSIGCQSCHGPAANHVEWAKSEEVSSSKPDFGLPKVDASICFACHSRRAKLSGGYEPGKPFLDYFSPALLRQDLYFPDGQILDEVFEYGSFQQSKMARAGVTCIDCHRPHDARLKAEGNALCTQCHTQTKPERFVKQDPSGLFDGPSHTHHPVGSAGAQCANCHMPERTYMKVDPRRDHSFVIPRPDLSANFGTPNACTTCHAGKDNAWAAESMDQWYGTEWRRRPTIAHAFAETTNGDQAAMAALRKLVDDHDQAGIVRGSAIARMSRIGGTDVTADVRAASQDADPLVRLGAAEAAGNIPPEHRLEAIGDLLGDETRAVRVAAVTALGSTPMDLLGDQRRRFEKAVEDLRAYVETNADVAETQSNYGFFLFGQQRTADAEAAFRRAISLDPTLEGSRANLAEFYRATGQNDNSEQTYREAISISPEHADLRYGHALSLVRKKAMADAIKELEEAVRLDPASSRYKTTLAVALDSVGRTEDSLDNLDRWAAHGDDADIIGLALQYSLKLQRLPDALKYAEVLARLRPHDQQISGLIGQLRQAINPK